MVAGKSNEIDGTDILDPHSLDWFSAICQPLVISQLHLIHKVSQSCNYNCPTCLPWSWCPCPLSFFCLHSPRKHLVRLRARSWTTLSRRRLNHRFTHAYSTLAVCVYWSTYPDKLIFFVCHSTCPRCRERPACLFLRKCLPWPRINPSNIAFLFLPWKKTGYELRTITQPADSRSENYSMVIGRAGNGALAFIQEMRKSLIDNFVW